MRLAALFSGGKDSTYAIYKAINAGHSICCLLSVNPASSDSHLLHYPGIKYTKIQAASMGIPHYAIHSDTDSLAEDHTLNQVVQWAMQNYNIDGILHGGIRSIYQRDRFEHIAKSNNLAVVSPVWRNGPAIQYMSDIIQAGFKFIIQSVSAGGLNEDWLGRLITTPDIKDLHHLSRKHGFAIDFEGGEAETFVVDCPLFSRPIMLCGTHNWDGYIGRFEISDAILI